MRTSAISELKPYKSMWMIKVKVIRLWKQYSAAGGETMEMVLIDSNGDRIHASVKKELVAQFEPALKQGYRKILLNFALTQSVGSYRTSKHAYKIGFLSTTRVRYCDDWTDNVPEFSPVKYREVLEGAMNPDYLVDVIGQVVEVSNVEVVAVNGKDTNKIALQLRDSVDDRLTVVLWGKFANDIDDAIQGSNGQSVIFVLRFGKIKVWKDEYSISNAYNVSDIFVNPTSAEAHAFIEMLPKDNMSLSIVEANPNRAISGVSDKDDFFVHTSRKNIAELFCTKQLERCILMSTVVSIDADMGWFYLSCKVCSKKVLTVPNETIEDGSGEDVMGHIYFCVKCNTYKPSIMPRYKLHLVVVDETRLTTKLLLFDNHAVQLLRQPCTELAGPMLNDMLEETNVIPEALNSIIGKTFLFKLSIEKENLQYKHDTYKVMKIISNKELIEEFEQFVSPKASEDTMVPYMSAQSDAPEGYILNVLRIDFTIHYRLI
ncbi:replication protein A 70 kDa DNA-binding subunit A-like [Brassica napus]|nr:replication protein A 70 kDa DNA-binding subunit A-like [Brassica napus]